MGNVSIGTIFMMAYVTLMVGLAIYIFVLATRFVKAHQRGADALESIAQTLAKQAEKSRGSEQ